MSATITYDVRDQATPALERAMARLTPEQLGNKIGPPMQDLTRERLGALPRNSRGWPTTRHFENYVDKVFWLPQPSGVIIAIFPAVIHGRNVGLRQAVFGGDIEAKTAKTLVIAISPVSYGKVPSDFPDLFPVKTKKGWYLCQHGEEYVARSRGTNASSTKGGFKKLGKNSGGNYQRRRAATLNFLFKAIGPSVSQPGNRDILPSLEEYRDKAFSAIARDWRAN